MMMNPRRCLPLSLLLLSWVLPVVSYRPNSRTAFLFAQQNANDHQRLLSTKEERQPLSTRTRVPPRAHRHLLSAAFMVNGDNANNKNEQSTPQNEAPPPMFNGQRVLPGSIVMAGLKASGGVRVPAVFAILRGGKEWKDAAHMGVTQDLFATLQAWSAQKGSPQHVRALSFTLADPLTMQQVVDQWKEKAEAEGTKTGDWSWVDPSSFLFDAEDDDDDDDDDWDDDDDDLEMAANAMAQVSTLDTSVSESPDDAESETIVSPFATTTATTTAGGSSAVQFTVETVDKVLDEVRPYLVADGGNVAVVGVDAETLNVQLELQGACGSCPSSTVTMQMGIERVLREQFGPDVTCEQINPLELSSDGTTSEDALQQSVQDELNRMSQAVIAMGGVVRLLNVDVDTGVVQLQFRGANKLQQGLELALLDLPRVNAVQFVSASEGE